MNETNSSWLSANPCRVTSTGTSNIKEYIDGYSGCTISTGTTLNTNLNGTVGMGITNPSAILTVSNSNNMRTRQVKAAVFTIERNDKNEVVSSKFVKELWVEIKNGASLDLAVAKELKGDFDPETTIVREMHSFSF
jgi:hypothetical protein